MDEKLSNSLVIPDRETELSNCTFVKTVLMLAVILYHSVVFWSGGWFTKNPAFSAPALAVFAEWLNGFLVYAFTLVSGYIFYYLKYEKGKYTEFFPFAVNKAKRLLIPYVFASVIWVIPITEVFLKYSLKDIVTKFVLACSPAQLWFLVMLFMVFMAAWCLSDFFAKHDLAGAAAAAGFYVIGLLGGRIFPNVFCIWTSFSHILFFWLGFKLCQKQSALIKRLPSVLYVAVNILLFAVRYFLSGFDGAAFSILGIFLTLAVRISGAVMAFAVLQTIAQKVPWKQNRLFIRWWMPLRRKCSM